MIDRRKTRLLAFLTTRDGAHVVEPWRRPRWSETMVKVRAYWITASLGIVLGLGPVVARAQTQPASSRTSEFSTPPGLRTQVDFWKSIFATYSTQQVVIHDSLHLDVVYAVLDFRPLAAAGMSDVEIDQIKHRTIDSELARIRGILTRLHQLGPHPQGLSAEEQHVFTLFRRVKGSQRFLDAAAPDRLRTQSGLRERFARGIEIGARYWPEIERIFREEGVPRELTRLPLVESCFNVRAYSKAGAAGVWQFMPATGRRFMRVDHVVDERRDPIIAARAAARYLRADYEALGAWPLAITAYNHGRGGIARAVSTVGSTDIVDIVQQYNGPAFKFASRNFYAEFLAAVDVERQSARYFGDLNYDRPVTATTVRVPDYVKLNTLARCAGTSVDTLASLNPALMSEVVDGKLRVPRGYSLRLPAGQESHFHRQYAALSTYEKAAGQDRTYVVHRVRRGQTLVAIARRYGTTVQAIRKRNNLKGRSTIRAGQELRIPRG